MTQGRVKRCAAWPADSRSWPCPTATCRCSPTCSQPPGSPGTACCPVSWCTPTSRTRPCTAWPWNAWRSTRPDPHGGRPLLGPARRRSPRAAHRLHPARRRRRARSTGRLRPHSPRPGGPPRAAAYRDATTVIPASELCRSTAWDIASKNRGTREMRQMRMLDDQVTVVSRDPIFLWLNAFGLVAPLGCQENLQWSIFQLADVTPPSLLTHHSSIPHFSNEPAVSRKRSRYLGKSGSAIMDRACGLRDRVSIAAKTARPYQPVACPLGLALFFSPRLRGSA